MKMNEFKMKCLLISGLIFTGSAQAATVSYYTAEALFKSSTYITNTIDFEGLIGNSFFHANYDAGTGHYEQGSLTIQGVSFTGLSDGFSNETYIIGANAIDSSPYQITPNSASLVGGRTITTIDLQGAGMVNAFGFEFKRVGNSIYTDPLTYAIQLIFDDGTVENSAVTLNLGDGDVGYAGFIASGGNIAVINFYNLSPAMYGNLTPYIALDNVSFSNTSQITTTPVPAAAWLFGSALLGFAGLRRKIQA